MQDHSDPLGPISVDELDRIICDYSDAWEGRLERVIDLGDALMRVQPTYGTVVRLSLATSDVDERLDTLIAQVSEVAGRCLWIIGPRTRPPDLDARLIRRGFTVVFDCAGLVLDDLTIDIPRNPDVHIEALSWETVAHYAARCSDSPDPRWHQYLLDSAHRYLRNPTPDVQMYIALLDGELVGYAVLRLEPSGIAYLANAMTVKGFRSRGVYSSLTAHRVGVARAAGCCAAFCAAQTKTSAPILHRRGFRSVCGFRFLVPPRTSGSDEGL